MGIILLAAGSSSRMGKPKQLLLHNDNTLLAHAAQVAIDTGIKPVIAVLGANAGVLEKEIADKDVAVVINDAWSEGMASSIRCGLEKLLEILPEVAVAIILVCDQPFITGKLLKALAAKYQKTGKPIIASNYDGVMGTPALFDKTIFPALLSLTGDTGARKIMKENPGQLEIINFPLGNIDIDTDADYDNLLKSQAGNHE
ncbi:MAG: nucleotidyltransferase family protein [Ferruginibacter sp.]